MYLRVFLFSINFSERGLALFSLPALLLLLCRLHPIGEFRITEIHNFRRLNISSITAIKMSHLVAFFSTHDFNPKSTLFPFFELSSHFRQLNLMFFAICIKAMEDRLIEP
jgi:hypothetical protein